MPGFGRDLSDAEVAAVATYVRNSWGHAASAVTEGEVSGARRPAPARAYRRPPDDDDDESKPPPDEEDESEESNPPEEDEFIGGLLRTGGAGLAGFTPGAVGASGTVGAVGAPGALGAAGAPGAAGAAAPMCDCAEATPAVRPTIAVTTMPIANDETASVLRCMVFLH
jgi:hypothetical protein